MPMSGSKPKQLKLDSFFTSNQNRNETRGSECDDDKARRKRKLKMNFAIALCLVTNRSKTISETQIYNVSDCPVSAAASTSMAIFDSSSTSTVSIAPPLSPTKNISIGPLSATVTKSTTQRMKTTAAHSIPTVSINFNVDAVADSECFIY